MNMGKVLKVSFLKTIEGWFTIFGTGTVLIENMETYPLQDSIMSMDLFSKSHEFILNFFSWNSSDFNQIFFLKHP